MSHYYPIYVEMQNKPVLVVGGGMVAWRKVKTLLEHGAVVRIVSPELHPELLKLVDDVRCLWKKKEYSADDLQDEVLVFSCTEIEEVNSAVARNARESFRLINVVDDPEKCTFIVPSLLERGDLSIAVSTGGSSPIVARQIRTELEEHYGEAYKDYLTLLRSWRKDVKAQLTAEQKETFWNQVTDGEVFELIKDGRLDEAKGVMQKCFQSLLG
ncbi:MULTISPECIES: bifunctional precorrin-2 dehydrogenase/sirohydrochlorin ferrochelatase [Desulfitobacterium]|uniref:precorrin-2 dehydrogenase n=1 Tax=Desulfitobacterium dehalogenans (strain ATCC 51507 / DSM 9161 / JW/IU-DC1) TaxID=756499 RepID=I4AAX3_DESDJ|nr:MULTISPECIES: bifunctional precorrin-2 dehydrogenase/sirohydrochlorin ferrochelatase [Desulfitobacterium]AFM01108.1 precorrin-2 dehydrogenase [Desulfitobacterium dehalogenans ATCC 51507]